MPRKYFIAQPPRADWLEPTPYLPALTVFEPEQTARDTGILDASGRKIMSAPERPQIGYLPRK